MPHYLVRWQFKDTTAKGFVERPQDRTGPATTLVESFGGKLHCYYFAFGEYDGLGICEFPDAESVVAFSMKASSSGSFARFEATALLTRGRSRDEARTIDECELSSAWYLRVLGWGRMA